MTSASELQPVILCGGAGSRLWPLSRPELPKPFLALASDVSLLEAAMRRLGGDPLLVASAAHRHLLPPARVILEEKPCGTAPAIAAAALQSAPEAILVVTPADHLIDDDVGFARSIARAAEHAEAGWICVLGVAPTEPSSAYGYILPGEGAAVSRFVEKPVPEEAARLIAQGALWNAGIVVAKPRVVIEALRQHAPGALHRSIAISFDHAVLERYTKVAVTRLETGWRDVGTWEEVARLYAPGSPRKRPARPLVAASGFDDHDARWRLGAEIDLDGVEAVGRAFGALARRRGVRPEVVVGHDAQVYSEAVKNALICGLLASGMRVHDIGLAKIPAACSACEILVGDPRREDGWTGLKLGFPPPLNFGPEEMSALASLVLEGGSVEAEGSGYHPESG